MKALHVLRVTSALLGHGLASGPALRVLTAGIEQT